MLRNLFCILVAAVWTTFGFFASALIMLFSLDASASLWWVQRMWSPVLLWAGGARLEVSGLENVDFSRPHVFVSNHQSSVDIPTLFAALPVKFRFAAKKALQYVPFLGWYLLLARFPLIDRARHTNAMTSLNKAGEQIRGGISIVMFPEGTRSDDARVMPFKKGPFSLAMKAGVPLVPITIEGSGQLMPKNSWSITPGPIRVQVGKPIDPIQFGEDREALIKAVRDVIIAQSLALGGKGGARSDAVAARGREGLGRAALEQQPEDAA